MKEIKKELTTTQTYYEYEALDGTIFNDEAECLKYENTEKCINRAKYNTLVLQKGHTEYDLFGFGDEECLIDLVKVKSQEDIDIVMKAWISCNQFYKEARYKDAVKTIYNMLKKAMKDDDIIFVNHGYETDDNFWFAGTQQGIINRMKALTERVNKNTDEQN